MMFIDAANYSENNTPANTDDRRRSAARPQVTAQGPEPGRAACPSSAASPRPYPLWDGTNRVLVAYRPCEVTRNGNVIVPARP